MAQYITTNLWAIWIIVTMLCLIIELSSGDFFLTCFAIGALCSVISSFIGFPFWLQLLVFVVCSVLCILSIRPSLLRKLHNRNECLCNADALIGRQGKVIESIVPGEYGYVKIDGDEWKAQSADGSPINVGNIVRVISRESIIITVERI